MKQFIEILSLRASGRVKRWHTIDTIRQQTVAEHSGQALSLLFMLHPDPSPNLVKAVLWHDTSERHVGDCPSPGLRAHPRLREEYQFAEYGVMADHHPRAFEAMHKLTDDEKQWLRAVDVLELVLHCHDEVMLGNGHFYIVQGRAKDWILNECNIPEVKDFLNWFLVEGFQQRFA